MFTINGQPAYTKAFLVYAASSGKRETEKLAIQLAKTESALPVRQTSVVGRKYPVELAPVLQGLTFDRPLWMFHVGPDIVFTTPKDPEAEIEKTLPPALGNELGVINIGAAIKAVEEIDVLDLVSWAAYSSDPSVPPSQLTVWQMVQLLSVTGGSPISAIQLEFSPLEDAMAELWGNIFIKSTADAAPKRMQLPLCHNLPRIGYPFQAAEFGKIKFERNDLLHNTVFELDLRLLAAQAASSF